eukprot:5908182-Alexandrium_andersonii.AAC.1
MRIAALRLPTGICRQGETQSIRRASLRGQLCCRCLVLHDELLTLEHVPAIEGLPLCCDLIRAAS